MARLLLYIVMPIKQMIILADDLTGANDTAIQFVNQGLSALVITHAEFSDPASFDSYDVIAINSNSRGMDADEAYRTIRNIIVRFAAGGRYFFYKKIDSVLRGNPGKELAAVMDELGVPLALVAPSFPANRSIVEHGLLYSNGAGKTGSGGATDAVKVFSAGSNRKVENIPLEEIRKGQPSATEYTRARNTSGTQVFVADALTDADLEIIYRISVDLDKPLILSGAAALANQVARKLGREKPDKRPDKKETSTQLNRNGSVLVIAGTRQGETAAQITTLSRIMSVPIIRFKVDLVSENKSDEAIHMAYNEAAEQVKGNTGLCIIAVESMFRAEIPAGNVDRKIAEGDETGGLISKALGVLAGKLLDNFQFPVMITTGGDTSLGVCKGLGITGIEPTAEICPGIPLGKIAGGAYKGRYLITKSGRFGDTGSLLEILRYLGYTEKTEKGVAY